MSSPVATAEVSGGRSALRDGGRSNRLFRARVWHTRRSRKLLTQDVDLRHQLAVLLFELTVLFDHLVEHFQNFLRVALSSPLGSPGTRRARGLTTGETD